MGVVCYSRFGILPCAVFRCSFSGERRWKWKCARARAIRKRIPSGLSTEPARLCGSGMGGGVSANDDGSAFSEPAQPATAAAAQSFSITASTAYSCQPCAQPDGWGRK